MSLLSCTLAQGPLLVKYLPLGTFVAWWENMIKRRIRDYLATYRTPALEKARAIRALLAEGEGLSVSEVARGTGISRQLALYHLKKLAASGLIVMMLEPCTINGGLRFSCWNEMALAAHFSRKLSQTFPRFHVAA